MMKIKPYTADYPRLFGFKTVEAPWISPDATVQRIDLKDALRYVPYRMDEMARDGVVWSQNGNTYILVEGTTFWHPGIDMKVDILSINGCGEVRWKVDVAYDGSISRCDGESIRVAELFGLEG